MPSYTTYAAVDEDYKFPPEVRQAIAAYPELLNAFAGKILEGTVSSHVGNGANPHGTTKAQVGLSLVDNTSDAMKPASTAQAALNAANLLRPLGRLPLEYKTSAGMAVSNTDVVVEIGAFNLVAGRDYKGIFRFNQDWPALNQAGVVELRKSITTDTSAAGTGVADPYTFWAPPVVSSGQTMISEFFWTASATETVNLKITMRRIVGSTSANIGARHFMIYDEGAQS